MKYQTLQNLPRLLVVICFAVFLASCSSSSTTDPDSNGDIVGDTNGDGILDLAEGDYNGDGVLDNSDLDFNGDGFVNEADDINGDGLNDFADFDVDGDGFTDSLDDINGDGLINSTDVVDNGPTNGGDCEVSGTDRNSSDDDWGNNCLLSDSVAYRDSSYSRGVQRILWCDGYSTDPLESFADGSYGPNTKIAVEDFQNDSGGTLDVDGVVGSATWGALRDRLVRLSTGIDYDTWGVDTAACQGQVLFYQKLDANLVGESWEMAETPGSEVRVVFSTGF